MLSCCLLELCPSFYVLKMREKRIVNTLKGKENIFLMLRNHQIIQKFFSLKFSAIFAVKFKEEKYNKKFLVQISETGGGKKQLTSR